MNRCDGGVLLRILLGLVLFAMLATAGVVWRDFARFADAPLAIEDGGISLQIPRGSSFKQIVSVLRSHGLSAAPAAYWRVLAERMRVTGGLHAGEYAIVKGTNPRQLLRMMADGKVLQHRFTIIDGWTFRQLRQALDADPILEHATRDLDDATIMQRIEAGGEDPEGRFLPETYAFVRGSSDLDILQRAHRAMQGTLAQAWDQREEGLPLDSPYEALILASIVEKETGQADERPQVAGVFIRRLRLGMALATDPTVIYGIGSRFNGNITRRDLETDTPYNTYLRAGLPPTPIAMPGKAAIEAALHPAPGKDLYFVARGDGSGRHVFSATLAEHNRAVACHQLKRCRE